MGSSLITADSSVQYEVKEAAVIVAALAWVMVVGSTALAAIMICGWRGAKNVAMDWRHLKATFYCR
jgi:hypothetical protein